MSLIFFILSIESVAHFAKYTCSLILLLRHFILYTLRVDESSSDDDLVSMVKMPLLSSVVDSLMEVKSSKVSVLDEISTFSYGLVYFFSLLISSIFLIVMVLGVPDDCLSSLKIFLGLILLALLFEEAVFLT